jgi:uncharacterized RDD family membrane protein YckC
MRCKDCGFANGDDDHRCLRCGRRLSGIVIAAPPEYKTAGYSGANALAAAVVAEPSAEKPPLQTALFNGGSEKVIPFERLQRQATGRLPLAQGQPGTRAEAPPKPAPPVARVAVRVQSAPPVIEQTSLDFVPAALSRARKLKTNVEAQVFCDQPVATPTHRFVAAAIDTALILIGFGVLVVTSQLLGGSFGTGKEFWISLGATFVFVTLLYGLIWAIAGRETAGMRFTDLQLITFDGFPLDARSRALRFVATWLSFCSGGLGLVWALADEESLTWQDHISKTFPTIREVSGTFVKQRR